MPTDTAPSDSKPDLGDGAPDDLEDPIIGKTIDGCKVIRKLGQGGMGVVYLAQHESLQQDFVLKILNPALTGAEDTVERFFREAQACAQLNHKGIVAIQNVGQEGDYYFIRMEYVEGVTLEDMIKEKNQLEWRDATGIVVEVAEALSHAHQKGMIHRDIKPENIMYTPKDEVKVMDFGLAKHVHSSAKVSVTGQIVGTPFFMSPEQAGGKPTDARSDIYSLGVTLYYMVTGVKPFNGKNLQEIFLKHFFYAPESPKIYNESLPDSLCEVVKKCLKKKKKERYQSAKALARDLSAVLSDPDTPLSEHKAAAPAGGGGDSEGDKTIATGGDEMDATVKVDGDDEGGATVKVGEEGDGEATVAVGRGTIAGQRGEVKTVSFRSASMVFQDEDQTLNLNDDDEDAHAGLDMPTAVIDALTGGEDGGGSGIAVEDDGEARARLKKRALIGALVILIPSLFVVLLNVMAQRSLGKLVDQYDTLMAKELTLEDAEELKALKQRLEQWDATNPLAPGKKARTLVDKLDAKIAKLEQERQDEDRRKKTQQKLKNKVKRRQQALEELKAQSTKFLEELEELRSKAEELDSEEKNSGPAWDKYMTKAKEYLKEVGSQKDKLSDEIKKDLEKVKFPIFVSTDPQGGEIYLNGVASKVKTPGKVWVNPYETYTIKVVKRGFVEASTGNQTADKSVPYEYTLKRQEVRPKLSFGVQLVRFGARSVEEPIRPIHAPQLAKQGKGLLYFVGRGGFLRALELKQEGHLKWRCSGKGKDGFCKNTDPDPQFKGEDNHQVAMYGDPTPRIALVPGRIVLVGSLQGRLTAHDPSEGTRRWTKVLDSPVTSPPVYKPAFKMIAVGTSLGTVYFLNEAGQIRGTFPTHRSIRSAPYFYGNRFCVAGSSDNRLYLIDWRTNRTPVEVHRVDLGSPIVIGPVRARKGNLLVGTADGRVHQFSIVMSKSRGKRRARLKRASKGTYGRVQSSPVTSIVTYLDKVYYTVGRRLYARSIGGGDSRVWSKEYFQGEGALTAPLVDEKLIYICSRDGTLYAIERHKGEVRWSYPIPNKRRVVHAPFKYGEELFVIAEDKIHVLMAD